MTHAVEASTIADAPILVDKFLDAATECDVDCIADYRPDRQPDRRGPGDRHRRHGAHRGSRHPPGDSACALPPYSLLAGDRRAAQGADQGAGRGPARARADERAVRDQGRRDLCHRGQPPRQSRTVPFVSKATGIPWAKIAAKVMAGKSLAELGVDRAARPAAHVGQGIGLPLQQVPRRGRDPRPGDAQHRRGHGHRPRFPAGLRQEPDRRRHGAADQGHRLHLRPATRTRRRSSPWRKMLAELGFSLIATAGTGEALRQQRHPRHPHQQARPGPAEHPGLHQERQGPAHHQHADEKGPQTDEGKIRRDGRDEPGADGHDDHRREGGGTGDRRRCRRRTGACGRCRSISGRQKSETGSPNDER